MNPKTSNQIDRDTQVLAIGRRGTPPVAGRFRYRFRGALGLQPWAEGLLTLRLTLVAEPPMTASPSWLAIQP